MRRLIHILTGIALICMPAALAGCTDRAQTIAGAEGLGLTDVVPAGFAFARCGRDDTTATYFTANNPQGRRVRGVACGSFGLLGKATTIRIIGPA